MITIEDFDKLDMRVGTVVRVEDFPKAKKPAYQLWIDFGPLGIRKSSAGITALYPKQALQGRQVIAVVNFPPKKVADFVSEVLVLGVADADARVVLLRPEAVIAPGGRVS